MVQTQSLRIVVSFKRIVTNAVGESFNAKIKALRVQLRGVSDIELFSIQNLCLIGQSLRISV